MVASALLVERMNIEELYLSRDEVEIPSLQPVEHFDGHDTYACVQMAITIGYAQPSLLF